MSNYVSFAHAQRYGHFPPQVSPPTESQRIKENCLVSYYELDQIKESLKAEQVYDFEGKHLKETVDRIITIINFSNSATSTIISRLKTYREIALKTLIYSTSYDLINYPRGGNEDTHSELHSELLRIKNNAEEEAIQMRQLVFICINLNKKLDKIIERIQQKGFNTEIPTPMASGEIICAVKGCSLPGQAAYIPPKLSFHSDPENLDCFTVPKIVASHSRGSEYGYWLFDKSKETTSSSSTSSSSSDETSILTITSARALAELTPIQFSTKVEVEYDVGFGNELFVRGEGAGLSWEKGIPLTYENGKWCLELQSEEDTQNCAFKFLVNDTEWEEIEGNHQLEIGSAPTHTLTIKMPVAQ